MIEIKLILTAVVFVSFSMLFFSIVDSKTKKKELAARLEKLDITQPGISLDEIEMAKTFFERVLEPFFSKIGKSIRKHTPSGFSERTSAKLVSAGYYGADPTVFLGVKVILSLVLTVAGSAAGTFILRKPGAFLLYACFFAPMGFLLPDLILSLASTKRKNSIQDNLPDFLDVLTVSVEAGLGFEQAISHASEKMTGPISDEFKRMLQELRLGKKRSDALRSIADRLGIADMKSFCTALIQADQLGVSIGDVLSVQSDGIRTKRRLRTEEAAMKAPIKMLFPLVFFIFPALFIILLGPACINIMENLKTN